MFFRFGAALVLVVLTSLAATGLEKKSLELKRAVSRQHYRLLVLENDYLSQRVLAEQLGAPSRLIGAIDPDLLAPERKARPAQSERPSGSLKKRRPTGPTPH